MEPDTVLQKSFKQEFSWKGSPHRNLCGEDIFVEIVGLQLAESITKGFIKNDYLGI